MCVSPVKLNRCQPLALVLALLTLLSGPCAGLARGAEGATAGKRWWDGAVFYEVFVRSFADSEEGPLANDGIGDLRGLIDKLDYLNDGDPETDDDLGVTGIWLMPIMQSPSYHGYDTTDYYTVEEDYGTNEDFLELIEQAHARGIRVIVDLVLNHSSHKHPKFVGSGDPRSEFHDWYRWERRDPGYKGPWGQGVWHEVDGRYYYGVFSRSMPDLNYENPAVTREMLKVTKYWLTEMRADGYRLDAIKHLIERGELQEHTLPTHRWLRGFYSHYKRVNPSALTVGEVWTDTPTVATYVGDQMDLAFDFDQAYATIHAARTGEKDRLAKSQAASWRLFPRGQFATFLANHDMDRTMSQIGGDVSMAKLGATIQLTSPGVPFVYYGEEVGMAGHGPHPDIRSPMQWSGDAHAGFSAAEPWHRIDSGYPQANVAVQDADADSLLNLYRRLIRLRQAHKPLAVGDIVEVPTDHPAVYAYLRRAKGQAVLVVVNLGAEPVDRYALALDRRELGKIRGVRELLQGVTADAPAPSFGDGTGGYQPIGVLGPRTGYVLALEAGGGR
jgi:alpha-amylase